MLLESTKALSAAHFEISMPKGARNIPEIPTIMTKASLGSLTIRPCMSSMLRLPVLFSTAPTERNISDFETAWNTRSRMPAQTASCRPTPAHAVISPRLDMVEYASTFLPSLCEMARSEAAKNVKPPIVVTIIPARFPLSAGERRISRYTPALTIVAE